MLDLRTAPRAGAPARLPERLSETVPTVIVGPDRLGMEGLRSILRDSRFRVVDSRERITAQCPGITAQATTFAMLIGGALGVAEAIACAQLIRTWHTDHRILAILEAHTDDPAAIRAFDGWVARNSLGDHILEAFELAQPKALRHPVRARPAFGNPPPPGAIRTRDDLHPARVSLIQRGRWPALGPARLAGRSGPR